MSSIAMTNEARPTPINQSSVASFFADSSRNLRAMAMEKASIGTTAGLYKQGLRQNGKQKINFGKMEMKRYRTGQDWETDMIDRALRDHQRRDFYDGEQTEMDDLVAVPLQRGGHKGDRVAYVTFRQLVHGPEIDLRGMMQRARESKSIKMVG